MMLSVLVWLGMWGQVQPDTHGVYGSMPQQVTIAQGSQLDDPGIVRPPPCEGSEGCNATVPQPATDPEIGPSGSPFSHSPFVMPMAGHLHCLAVRQYEDGTIAVYGSDDSSGCNTEKATLLYGQTRLPKPETKPAEHVIEIKTVRSHPDHETSDWRECGADDEVVLANAAINGIFTVICRSTKVTRELWIDNVKFGIIKGLD